MAKKLCQSLFIFFFFLFMETFVNVSELFHHRPETRFPEHNSAASLAKDFTASFRNKIRRIREDLGRSKPNNVLEFRCVAAKCQFIIFAIISPTKPVATVGSMFFVNLSMESGILSTNMKVASVNALLQEFKNFKPISNESFLFH